MNPPSLIDLLLLTWEDDQGDTHRFRLLNLISGKWHQAGILLGHNSDSLINIKQKTVDNEERFQDVLSQWIDNDGYPPKYPLTWKGIFELLYDLGRGKIAEELKQALSASKKCT